MAQPIPDPEGAAGPSPQDDQAGGAEGRRPPRPVAVPSSEPTTDPAKIVVGVDGSEPSHRALRWAVRQAALTGSTVEAVTAWELPGALGWADVPESPDHLDLEGHARHVLSEAVSAAQQGEQAVRVDEIVVMGNASHAILDQAAGAQLIVVGVRGHGTFRATLLGSVSHTVTLHAPCPVVVVRGSEE